MRYKQYVGGDVLIRAIQLSLANLITKCRFPDTELPAQKRLFSHLVDCLAKLFKCLQF